MKEQLTFERAAALFSYEPSTGLLHWRTARWKTTIRAGDVAGYRDRYGIRICTSKYGMLAGHRVVWLLAYGVWPTQQIDHINGDQHDNRLDNLRDVSHEVNMQNRKGPHRNGSSGFLGVSKGSLNRWNAVIHANGKNNYIGTFQTPQLAHEAYLKAKRELHLGNTL